MEWCVQVTAAHAEASTSADAAPVSDRVDLHNSTAAENGKPEPPDPSMSGDQYAEAIRNSKIQCRWCKRTRCLSVVGNFMTVPCHAPRVDELMGSLFLDGCDFF